MSSQLSDSIQTADTGYNDSFECSDGCALIANCRSEVFSISGCSESECCDKVCSSYDSPRGWSLMGDSGTTVCDHSQCTREQRCEQGETHSK